MQTKLNLLILSLFLTFQVSNKVRAQILYPSWSPTSCNTLDNLSPGSLVESGSDFWANFPGADSDATITNEQTFSGNRALRLDRPNAGYFDDVVYYMNPATSGRYRIEWMMFLPVGSAATAGLINDFDGTSGPNSNWAYRIEFNGSGLATILLGQGDVQLTSISYPRGRWFRVAQVIDLDDDYVSMFIDYNHVADWNLSDGEDSFGSLSLDAINIWAKVATDLPTSQSPIYIDNMCISLRNNGVIVDCFEPNPSCLLGEDLYNECAGLQAGFVEGEWTLGSCDGGGNGEANICLEAIPLDCNYTFLGNNFESDNSYTSSDYTCATRDVNYNGGDEVFRIDHPGGRFVVSLMNDDATDFDIFLHEDAICDGGEAFGLAPGRQLPTCIAKSDNVAGTTFNREQIYFPLLDAGTYYLVVDGVNSDEVGSYELALSCEFNCFTTDATLSCGGTANNRIPSREEQPRGNFTSNYCGIDTTVPGTGITGNEHTYRLNITDAGTYDFNLTVPSGSTADFELIVLASTPEANGGTCALFDDCLGIATNGGFGEPENLSLFLDPGEYFLVIDGWYGSFGDYTISMSCDAGSECDSPAYSFDSDFGATRLADGRYSFGGILGDFSTEDSYLINYIPAENSGLAITGNGTADFTIDFAGSGGNYTVCYPYYDFSGCLNYRCVDLCVESNDAPFRFLAEDQPDNERVRLLLSVLPPPNDGGVSNVTWFYYDDGEPIQIGSGVSVFISYPEESCFTRTYFVRYYDNSNECWRIERRTETICPPLNCPDPVYNQNCGSQVLTLDANGDFLISSQGAATPGEPWLVQREPVTAFTGQSISLSRANNYNVEVCFPITDSNGCISYCCQQYCLDNQENSPQVLYDYDVETNTYQFELAEDGTVSEPQWISLGNSGPPISGSGTTANVPTPANCTTQTYYVRYFSGGCWKLARRTVYICDPYACDGIGYQYVEANNTFSLSIEGADSSQPLAWVDDDTGAGLGTTPTIPVPVPPGNCVTRNISVRYYDATRRAWIICCRTIYLCDPNQCDGILYQYAADAQAFDLSVEGADPDQPIAWVDDDTGGSLGSGATIPVPAPPGTCVTRNISVRYYDTFRQSWVICCRSIYLCSPVNCEENINFSYFNGNAIVTADIGDASRNWFVNGDAAGSGASLAVPISQGQNAEVCVQYFDTTVGGYRTCCKNISIPNCSLPLTSFILLQGDEGTFALNTSDEAGVTAYDWEVDGTSISASRDLTLNLPPGTYTLCLTVTNSCGSQRFCRVVNIPNTDTDLILRPLPGACGEPGEIIDIPIYADNFTNILNYQITLGLTDTSVAKIVGLELENIPGVEDYLIYNGARAAVIWDNASGLFYPDGTLLITLKVAIQSGGPLSSDVIIASGPVPSYAENGNGEEIPISMLRGTVGPCSEVDVSGRLITETGQGIARATVSLYRNGIIVDQLITDATGQYEFMVTPDGADYAVRPEKLINYRNHVNSGDLSAVRRHIFGTAPLVGPYRRIAADATNIGSINSGDISSIRQLVFGLISEFPGVPSWEFVPQDHVFADPDNPTASAYPREINLGRVNGSQTGLNFIGLKMGDPSSGADPQNARPDGPVATGRSLNDLSFMVGEAPPVRGVPWEMDVYAYNFTDMLATQFSLAWNSNVVDLLEIKNENTTLGLTEENFSLAGVRDGQLPWLWFAEENAISLPDSALLFTLRFNIIGDVGDTASVSFTEMPTEFFFEDTGGEIAANFGEKEQIVEVFTSTSNYHPLDEIRVYPNPASSAFFVEHPLQHPTAVSLYNLQGALLKNWPQSRGNEHYDVKDLPAGTYLLSFRQRGKTVMRRIVITR
ncbi:T9SS type A sorting domain-containing protein [Neolewinella aurantiaca]|uniref:T9SS type A sorting domain-containing protein n=1 Tax=Neolewinella aurantiaca TaxID=2602767 RepID=A0A5C7FI75_9BACT|nr:T9SS type A sorting domain-containing protein [Neolewinella aurantiaca]TXF90226.1 T9SS type A sorting domain-containing protein [Neolewinella aurantiaca]